MDKRFKNADWLLPTTTGGEIQTWDAVKVAVLMDIRDELQTLNGILRCPKFLGIPRQLADIVHNTKKRKRKP